MQEGSKKVRNYCLQQETIPHFSDKIPINWKKVEGSHKKKLKKKIVLK